MNDELASLRAEVDRIDAEIAGLLARRFERTGRIGVLKALAQEAPRDPRRQGERALLLKTLAAEHGLDEAFLSSLYRVISDAVVARHVATRQRPDSWQ